MTASSWKAFGCPTCLEVVVKMNPAAPIHNVLRTSRGIGSRRNTRKTLFELTHKVW
jgi:hypothetical protein